MEIVRLKECTFNSNSKLTLFKPFILKNMLSKMASKQIKLFEAVANEESYFKHKASTRYERFIEAMFYFEKR